MKVSISNKYAAAFGIISLVVTAVVAVSTIALLVRGGNSLRKEIEKTEREIYEESHGKTQYNVANYLGSYLFVPLYQLDIDSINRLIKDMKKALPIDSFLITDPSGRVLTDGTKQNHSYGIQLNLDRSSLARGTVIEKNEPAGRRISFCVRAGNYTAGYGEIVFSHAPLKNAIERHRQSLSRTWNEFTGEFIKISMISFALVLMLAGLLSFLFSRTLSRPLIALKEATDHVARGNLDHRVMITSEDEIGELAASFNRMVSDLKISTERLRDANEKLKALDSLKSEFISIVSHELRTPITSVKAFAELILIKPAMPEKKKEEFLKIIKCESDRLARLINDILDITRIETGKLYWHMDTVSLDEVVRHSVASMQPLASNKHITIIDEMEEGLPSLFADRDRLVQVVTNIVSNAVKFTQAGGKISVRASRHNGVQPSVTISVSDTGIGIPEDSLHLIFDKFHRAQNNRFVHTSEGTGLGLAIAREIVEHHGGVIRATNNPDRGSTISFTLPLEKGDSRQTPVTAGA